MTNFIVVQFYNNKYYHTPYLLPTLLTTSDNLVTHLPTEEEFNDLVSQYISMTAYQVQDSLIVNLQAGNPIKTSLQSILTSKSLSLESVYEYIPLQLNKVGEHYSINLPFTTQNGNLLQLVNSQRLPPVQYRYKGINARPFQQGQDYTFTLTNWQIIPPPEFEQGDHYVSMGTRSYPSFVTRQDNYYVDFDSMQGSYYYYQGKLYTNGKAYTYNNPFISIQTTGTNVIDTGGSYDNYYFKSAKASPILCDNHSDPVAVGFYTSMSKTKTFSAKGVYTIIYPNYSIQYLLAWKQEQWILPITCLVYIGIVVPPGGYWENRGNLIVAFYKPEANWLFHLYNRYDIEISNSSLEYYYVDSNSGQIKKTWLKNTFQS